MSSGSLSVIDHLTFVMAYYNNPAMLSKQYELWKSYPDELKRRVDFVIVDDGSQEPAHLVPCPEGLSVSIYRIKIDIPWNQDGARNLGCSEAKGPWLFMTDMDHMLPVKSLEYLLSAPMNSHNVYTFNRVEHADGSLVRDKKGKPKPHPNTYLMTKQMYWDVGGYDEYFRGLYGTDGMFFKRIAQRATIRHLSNVNIARVTRDEVSDADTRNLKRKEDRPPTFLVDAKKRKAADPEWADQLMLLNFEWEKVC